MMSNCIRFGAARLPALVVVATTMVLAGANKASAATVTAEVTENPAGTLNVNPSWTLGTGETAISISIKVKRIDPDDGFELSDKFDIDSRTPNPRNTSWSPVGSGKYRITVTLTYKDIFGVTKTATATKEITMQGP